MDSRRIIAETYDKLDAAGISYNEFEAELNTCDGPEDAIHICYKFQSAADFAKPTV